MRADAKEFREFSRTIGVISATLASIGFVGVSILVLIYSPAGVVTPGLWKIAAGFGVASVSIFSVTSIVALFGTDPARKWMKTKKEIEKLNKALRELFTLGWVAFSVLVGGLLFTFL